MSDNDRSTGLKRAKARARNRWVAWGIVGVVLVVSALGAWIAVRALQAKAELEAAQGLMKELELQALAFDVYGADVTLEEIADHTEKAIALTSDPIWRAWEIIPFAGPNLTAFRELAALTGTVVDRVVSPLLDAAEGISPATLAPAAGVIDLGPLIAAGPAVAEASEGAADALKAVEAIDTSGTVEQLAAARARIAELLTDITPLLLRLDSTVPLMPAMLGSDAPRTYVVMFQNPAESRALGGAALSFAVLKVDGGKIDLESTAAAAVDFGKYDEPVVAMPDGAREVHGGSYGTSIADTTLRPSFAAASEITREIWFRHFGYWIDGVVSIDPVALSYVVGATEPITLSTGDVLTRESLVPLLLNEVYQRYSSADLVANNVAQDAVYGEAVSAMFTRLTSDLIDPGALLEALILGWQEHRLLYWSAHADEQAQLAEFGLHGEFPVSDASTDRVGVYFQDHVGAKLNFYLKQTVHLAKNNCRADGRESYRVTVDLQNGIDPAAASTLAPAIVGNSVMEGVRIGFQRMIVMLYAPPGSTIVARAVDGTAIGMDALHDTTYPVSRIVVTIPPGGVTTASFDIVAASPGSRTLEALVTPMVNPTTVLDEVLECGG
jgi:hypothetical protein